MATEKKKPIEQIRQGAVVASIWENEGKQGRFYKFTLERLYTTAAGDWKSSNSFSGSDTENLLDVANKATRAIRRLKDDPTSSVPKADSEQ